MNMDGKDGNWSKLKKPILILSIFESFMFISLLQIIPSYRRLLDTLDIRAAYALDGLICVSNRSTIPIRADPNSLSCPQAVIGILQICIAFTHITYFGRFSILSLLLFLLKIIQSIVKKKKKSN
jgi:hypothetical protein